MSPESLPNYEREENLRSTIRPLVTSLYLGNEKESYDAKVTLKELGADFHEIDRTVMTLSQIVETIANQIENQGRIK